MNAKFRRMAASKSCRAAAGTEKLSIRNRSSGCLSKSNVNECMVPSQLMRRMAARIDPASMDGRPDEEHRRRHAERAADGMKSAPGLQQLQRLVRSRIAPRVEQPLIRWMDHDERERNDHQDEQGGPHPERPAS